MSEQKPSPNGQKPSPNGAEPGAAKTVKATERPTTGRAFGPPGGIPGDKSLDFLPSAKRLLKRLRPHRMQVSGVVLLAVFSVGLSVLGPKILGRATDIIFAGAIGKRLPSGMTKEQVIEQTRASGNGRLADLLQGIDLIPGVGIDFDALRNVLLGVMALYVGAFFLSWMQGYILNGVVQRTILDLRSEVEAKLKQNAGDYTWVAAAIGSQNAASYQLATGKPVMAIGGFNGSDPSPTLAQFKKYVEDGKIHYFISGGMGGGMGGEGTSSQISSWLEENFTAVTVGSATFYDLTSEK